MKILKSKSFWISFLTTVLLICLSVAYFTLPAKFLEKPQNQVFVKGYFQDKTKHQLNFDNLKASSTLDLCIKFNVDNFSINKNEHTNFIQADKASVKVFIPMLLIKKIQLKNIFFENVSLSAKRDKSGKFDFEELFPKSKSQGYKLDFSSTKVDFTNYKALLEDSYINPTQNVFSKGEKLSVTNIKSNDYIEIDTLSNISINDSEFDKIILHFSIQDRQNKDKCKFNTKIATSNIKLEKYLPYIQKFHPEITDLKGYFSAKGKINYSPKSKKGEIDIEINSNNLLVQKDSINLLQIEPQTSLKIDAKMPNGDLDINKIILKSKDVYIKSEGLITNANSKDFDISLNTKVKNTYVESALNIFPEFIKIKDDIISKLKKYDAKGIIDGDFSIKNAKTNLFMSGELKVKDFSLFNDKFLSSGNIKLDDKKMFFETALNIEKDEKFDIKGFVEFLKEKVVDIAVKTSHANIEKTQKNLLAIQDIIGFSLGPVPDMELKGYGNIDLKIKGKTSYVLLNGIFNFKDSYAKYNTLASAAKDVSGQIVFDNRKIIYKDIKGKVDGNNASLLGYHTLDGDYDSIIQVTDCNLKEAKTFIDNSPLLEVLKNSLILIEDIKGVGSAKINLFGTLTEFNSKGFVDVSNADVYFVDYSMPYKNAKGIVEFNNENVIFKEGIGLIANSPTTIKGYIDKNIANIELQSDNIDTKEALELINSSKALYETKIVLQDISQAQGEIKGKIFLKGDFIKNPNIYDYGIFETKENTKASFKYKNFPTFITVQNGKCHITQDKFSTDSIDLKTGDSTVNVKGSVKTLANKTLEPDLDLKIQSFKVADFNELKSSTLIKKEDKSLLNNLKKLEGTFSGNAKILKNNIYSNIRLNNVSATYSPLNLPLKIADGTLSSKNEDLVIEGIKLNVGDSIFVLKGEVKSLLKEPQLAIRCSADILPQDIEKYINPNLINPIQVNNNLPIDLKYKSSSEKWSLTSLLKLQSSNFISYNGAKLGSQKPHSIVVDIEGQKDNLKIKNAKIIQEGETKKALLAINGEILKINSNVKEFKNLRISTSDYLDLNFLNPVLSKYSNSKFFTDGKFNTQVLINGTTQMPKIKGDLKLKDIKVPSVETSVNTALFEFDNEKVILKESIFTIGSSFLNVTADFDNLFELPTIAKNLKISSKYINLDEINKIISKNKANYNYTNSAIASLTIQDATIVADELIVKNLITQNAIAKFSFTPDWILTVSQFKTDTAGGSLNGHMTVNTKTTEIDGKIEFNNMLANATSSTFLGVSNEVYGTLNGHSVFKTKGMTDKELVKNLNGNASFKVTKGRLVRLGSTEYLLKAVNVIQGGVTSLNLNKVINLFSPKKTGYFDELNVDFTIEDGVVNTNNLITKSENLNLFIAGKLDMDTNYSDLTILGRLSRKGTSFLGPLGKLSLNSFINSLPGVGSDSNSYISTIFPHISNIPGFELNDDNYRRFVVNIEGDLYDSSSVKEFRWIR